MPEYIEREALLAELEDEIDFVSPLYNAEQNQYFTMGLRCAYRDAQRFPAADVSEVVRCKNCKNYELMKSGNCHFCNEFGGRVTEKDFCSRAQKMDGKEVERE